MKKPQNIADNNSGIVDGDTNLNDKSKTPINASNIAKANQHKLNAQRLANANKVVFDNAINKFNNANQDDNSNSKNNYNNENADEEKKDNNTKDNTDNNSDNEKKNDNSDDNNDNNPFESESDLDDKDFLDDLVKDNIDNDINKDNKADEPDGRNQKDPDKNDKNKKDNDKSSKKDDKKNKNANDDSDTTPNRSDFRNKKNKGSDKNGLDDKDDSHSHNDGIGNKSSSKGGSSKSKSKESGESSKIKGGKIKWIIRAVIALILCFVFLIIIISSMIAGVVASLFGNQKKTSPTNSKSSMSEDDKNAKIIFTDYSNYSYDKESGSYSVYYYDICSNDYEPVLYTLWKKISTDSFILNRSSERFANSRQWDRFYKKLDKKNDVFFQNNDLKKKKQKKKTDKPEVDTSKYKKSKLDKYKYKEGFDYYYDLSCMRYYSLRKNTSFTYIDNDTNSFLTKDDYEKENYLIDYKDKKLRNNEFAVVYIDNVIKTCLDAFINPKTHKVYVSPKAYLKEYKKTHKKEVKGLSKDEQLEKCRNYLIKRIIHNLEGKKGPLESCITATYKKGKTKTKNEYLTKWLYQIDEKTKHHNYYYNTKKFKHRFTTKCFRSIYEECKDYYNTGSGNADAICKLAKKQLGNKGPKYWNGAKCWGGGPAEWCSIFIGWLFENSDIKPSEVGWCAYCPTFVSNGQSKGTYHSRGSGYSPKAGDIIFFQWNSGIADHVGIVVGTKKGKVITVEGNTDGGDKYSTVVGSHTYPTSYNCILGYINMSKYYKSSSGGSYSTGGVGSSTPILKQKIAVTDRRFVGHKVHLNSTQRRRMECIVTNENGGNGYEGCLLIAQCLRDACYYKINDSTPDNIKHNMGYDGADTGTPTAAAKRAVKDIFDKGCIAVKHRILYMYAPALCTSSWHESQLFIIEHSNGGGRVRFFDRR